MTSCAEKGKPEMREICVFVQCSLKSSRNHTGTVLREYFKSGDSPTQQQVLQHTQTDKILATPRYPPVRVKVWLQHLGTPRIGNKPRLVLVALDPTFFPCGLPENLHAL